MKRFSYDLVVVGAGSGGYAAARTARDAGASVALVDHGPLGGLCILRGCMPSKTLLATSDTAQEIRQAARLGINVGEPAVDLTAVMRRKAQIIDGFASYRAESLRSFPLYEGRAQFLNAREVHVGDDIVLQATSFVIATGSVVAPPMLAGLRETGFIDSDDALVVERLPSSLIVLGGGYVATELGQFFARLDVPTTMLIRSPRLLSSEDDDIGDALTLYFRTEGITVQSGVQLLRVERDGEEKVVSYLQEGEERSARAAEILYALGRVPNIASLELERAGVVAHHVTGISVGPDLRTSVPNIFAVGDVTGAFPLVHVAIYQGEIAARNALSGRAERADYTLQKAHTIFTDPQVAVVGETEKSLAQAQRPYRCSFYPFAEHGKAISIGKTDGFVKMLADPQSGRILGAAVVGPEGSDLIHEIIVAMHYEATVFDFVKIPHLHPTLAEIWTYPAEDLMAQIQAQVPAAVAAV
ncbi:MAG TPA: FAD-dependent oxidoreductase [Candidatus Acidoferrales bacterium]|nr:FAD-dependent oxidoreductase [Candidatus Acidoferrales bacterium]